MNENKKTLNNNSSRLRNYSEVRSFDRLIDPGSQPASVLTAGGDVSYNSQDINDKLKSTQKRRVGL